MVDVDVKIHNALRSARLLNTWWLPGAMRDAPPLSRLHVVASTEGSRLERHLLGALQLGSCSTKG
jgi:hypothetical protein